MPHRPVAIGEGRRQHRAVPPRDRARSARRGRWCAPRSSPSRCPVLKASMSAAVAFCALIVASPRAAAPRTTGSSALRRAISTSAALVRADLGQRVEHRRDHALVGCRSASRSAAPARARGPGRRASLASAARTDQCASGSSPEIELMKVSTSVFASALSAADRADGHCADTRSISSSTAAGSRQLRQRGDRFQLQVLIDAR